MRHDQHAPKSYAPWISTGISGLFLAATAGLVLAAPDAGPPAEMGLWYNHSGKGAVEIRPCAETGRDANYLCGFIVWLKVPNNKKGEPWSDGYNADPRKRKRPICGLPVLGSLRPMSDGSWDQGWVYDPEQGKSFDAAIQLHSPERLVLTGYKGIKFFSKTFVWKRAPDDLPRCDNTAAAPAADRQARAQVRTHVGKPTPPIPDKASLARASQYDGLVAPSPVPAVKPPAAAAR
jgi:uncharacterized protein (DUF2147 family)